MALNQAVKCQKSDRRKRKKNMGNRTRQREKERENRNENTINVKFVEMTKPIQILKKEMQRKYVEKGNLYDGHEDSISKKQNRRKITHRFEHLRSRFSDQFNLSFGYFSNWLLKTSTSFTSLSIVRSGRFVGFSSSKKGFRIDIVTHNSSMFWAVSKQCFGILRW